MLPSTVRSGASCRSPGRRRRGPLSAGRPAWPRPGGDGRRPGRHERPEVAPSGPLRGMGRRRHRWPHRRRTRPTRRPARPVPRPASSRRPGTPARCRPDPGRWPSSSAAYPASPASPASPFDSLPLVVSASRRHGGGGNPPKGRSSTPRPGPIFPLRNKCILPRGARTPAAGAAGQAGAGHSEHPTRCRAAKSLRIAPTVAPPRVVPDRQGRQGSLDPRTEARGLRSRTAQAHTLRGEGSNLQHPAPKAGVLPIELPRKGWAI